jgi:hypothetical protein
MFGAEKQNPWSLASSFGRNCHISTWSYFIFIERRTWEGSGWQFLAQKEIPSYVTAAYQFGIYFVACTEHKTFP